MREMLVLTIDQILPAPGAERNDTEAASVAGASEENLGGFEPGKQKYPTFIFPNSLVLKYPEIFEFINFQNFQKSPNSVILSASQNARIH